MRTRRTTREQPAQPPKLAPVVDHPTRRSRPRYKTLKATLGRSERDTLVVLRRKLATQIDSDDLPGHALAQLVRQFRDVDAQIRALDARAAEEAAAADDPDDDLDDDDGGGWDPSKL
jgi:hypothetical protein